MKLSKEVAIYNQNGIENGIGEAEERASKVATSFITQISQDNGIRVHNADDMDDYIQVNSNGVDLVNGNASIANFGETARVGKTSSSRFVMGADSLEAYDDTNAKYFEVSADGITYGSNTAASTGYADSKASAAQSAAISTAAADATSKANAAQSAAEATASADATSKANEARKHADNYMYYNSSSGLAIADSAPSTATKKVQIKSDGIRVQQSASNYADVTASGLDVYQGGSSVAKFGATTRIGSEGQTHIGVTSADVNVYSNNGSKVVATLGEYTNGAGKLDLAGVSNGYGAHVYPALVELYGPADDDNMWLSANTLRWGKNASGHNYIDFTASSDASTLVLDSSESDFELAVRGSVTSGSTLLGVIKVTKASVSSLPAVITDSAITSDMEVINCVLSNPSAQTGDWTVTTSSGYLNVSGTISGTTNITLYLTELL